MESQTTEGTDTAEKNKDKEGNYGQQHFRGINRIEDVKVFDSPIQAKYDTTDWCDMQVGGQNMNGLTIQKLTTLCVWLKGTKVGGICRTRMHALGESNNKNTWERNSGIKQPCIDR